MKFVSKSNDIAPIGIFLDLYPSENFNTPILPIPMRIDKLINGEKTLLIIPDESKIKDKCSELGISFNINIFIEKGLNNLVSYAKEMYLESKKQNLARNKITFWFSNTKSIKSNIPELQNIFTKILANFLEVYNQVLNNNDSKNSNKKTILIDYYDSMLEYINHKLKENKFEIKNNEYVQFYKTRRKKFYPKVLKREFKINNSFEEYSFVPYLIYDDLYECFLFNKQKIIESTNINNIIANLNNIINKELNIIKFNDKGIYIKFSYKKIGSIVDSYED